MCAYISIGIPPLAICCLLRSCDLWYSSSNCDTSLLLFITYHLMPYANIDATHTNPNDPQIMTMSEIVVIWHADDPLPEPKANEHGLHASTFSWLVASLKRDEEVKGRHEK